MPRWRSNWPNWNILFLYHQIMVQTESKTWIQIPCQILCDLSVLFLFLYLLSSLTHFIIFYISLTMQSTHIDIKNLFYYEIYHYCKMFNEKKFYSGFIFNVKIMLFNLKIQTVNIKLDLEYIFYIQCTGHFYRHWFVKCIY